MKEGYFFDNKTWAVISAVLAGVLIAFLTSLIIIHATSASASGDNDMYGIMIFIEVEILLRPVVAILACKLALHLVSRFQKLQVKPWVYRRMVIVTTVLIFLLNLGLSTVQYPAWLYFLGFK